MKAECDCEQGYDRVLWLACDRLRINPRVDFDGLSRTTQNMLRKSFEYWMMGFPRNHRHHGWPSNPDRKECYTFKDAHHRLYGFLVRSKDGPQHDLCVICIYATKTKKHSDPALFARLNEYRQDEEIIGAIALYKKQKDML